MTKDDKKIKIVEHTKRFRHFKIGTTQLSVEAYPKDRKHDRSDIDVLRFSITAKDTGRKFDCDVTPDELVELAGIFVNASYWWLVNYKPYWNSFMARKRALAKKFAKSLTP